MSDRRIIRPGLGVDPLELGRTREELWARTDSNVLAYLGKSGPGERSDDFVALGIHAHYRGGRATRLSAFPRVNARRVLPLELEGEDIAEFTRDDVLALLELRGHEHVDAGDQIRVPSLGLTFGFRQDFGQPEQLDVVFVDELAR